MAIKSVTLKHRGKWGNMRANVVDVVHSGAYTTGGETIAAKKVGLGAVHVFFANPIANYNFAYSTGKMKAFKTKEGAEVTGGQSVAATTRCLFIGI